MAKLAAKKKPTKPDAPKKPSSRSKTGNAECSQAASNWQLSIRGKATLNPGTYQTLAKCRALSKSGQMADAQGRTGKLSAMGEQAVKARLQSRFDSGLITQKSRTEKLNVLLKKRSQAIESGKSAATSEGTVSSIVKRAETPMSEVLMTGHRWKSDGTLQIDRGRYQAAITDEINATLDYAKNGKNSRKSLKEGVGNFPKDHPLHGQAVAYVKGRIDDIPFENLAARTKVKTLESLKTKFAESLAPNTPREQKAAILGNVARSIAKPTPPPAVQAAPQPARYSLQGKLAPGRGTEERKALAAHSTETRDSLTKMTNSEFDRLPSDMQKRASQNNSSRTPYVNTTVYTRAVEIELEKTGKIPHGFLDTPIGGITHRERINRRLHMGMTPEDAAGDLKPFLEAAGKKGTSIPAKITSQMILQQQSTSTPPKPAEPARYSLGGKLAPGRGTEERLVTAEIVRDLRKATPAEAAKIIEGRRLGKAIPSKFDKDKVAVKQANGSWKAYTPRQRAYILAASKSLKTDAGKLSSSKRFKLSVLPSQK